MLTDAMITVVEGQIGKCAAESEWRVGAASIEPTHTHLLLTYTSRDIDNVVKWLKDQTTKAIHRQTKHGGPVWSKGKWRSFIFDTNYWHNTKSYIEKHNERRGVGSRPYPFLSTDLPDELR